MKISLLTGTNIKGIETQTGFMFIYGSQIIKFNFQGRQVIKLILLQSIYTQKQAS